MVIHEHNHFDIRNVGGILLEKLVIKGGNQLNGRVRVSSAKKCGVAYYCSYFISINTE